jgi:predicted permease
MLRAIVDRLQTLPGVEHASFGNALPFVSAGNLSGFTARLVRDPSIETRVQGLHRTVAPGYFAALRLRLRAGRLFTDLDAATSQPVMVVNRSFADQYLGPNPIGQRVPLALYRKAEWEVIGVVDDMKQGGLERAGLATLSDGAQPEMFSPYRQFDAMRLDSVFFVVRTAGDPAALGPLLRAVVREQASHLVLDSVRTMEDRVLASLAKPRSYALVLTGFAACALAIAVVGLFGVLSYGVAQRSREIGVRTALGAQPSDVVRLVLRSAVTITAAGLTLGLVTASLLAGFLRAILFGVEPFDPVTFAVAPVVLALAAALACAAPARRAACIDPLRALRAD